MRMLYYPRRSPFSASNEVTRQRRQVLDRSRCLKPVQPDIRAALEAEKSFDPSSCREILRSLVAVADDHSVCYLLCCTSSINLLTALLHSHDAQRTHCATVQRSFAEKRS